MSKTIYLLTNKINNKKYVGQTSNYKERIRSHFNDNVNSLIHMAIVKYGKDSFLCEKIVIVENILADETETKAIMLYNTICPSGYNLESGGCKNKVMSEESRKKMSVSKKGRTPWNKGKKCKPSWNKGVPATEEVKQRLIELRKGCSSWNKGKPMSEETKEKLRQANKGQAPPNKGIKMSEEQKLKLSIAHMGKPSPKKGKKYIKVNGL